MVECFQQQLLSAGKKSAGQGQRNPKKIFITTIHKAKGLEWDTVYLINCNDEFFPGAAADTEEERRIFYVAITRAKRHLHVSFVRNQKVQRLTRFVTETDEKLFSGFNFANDVGGNALGPTAAGGGPSKD